MRANPSSVKHELAPPCAAIQLCTGHQMADGLNTGSGGGPRGDAHPQAGGGRNGDRIISAPRDGSLVCRPIRRRIDVKGGCPLIRNLEGVGVGSC